MRSRFGLTGRGWTLTIGGAILAATASFIGEADLTWVGLFLSALPLMGMVCVLGFRPRLAARRSIEPDSVPVGGKARAHVAIANSRTASFSSLHFMDQIPPPLGREAAFDLPRGLGRWRQAAGYDLPARQRGHFQLGPLKARLVDPLGTAWRCWQVKGPSTSMRVTPRLWPLSLPRGGRNAGASGEATPQRIGAAGPDDVLIREHRHGDGMRRVHWRMSAKRGELMVRVEEQPWDPAMIILIDTRAEAHVGSGPDSSLEWAISAGASLATVLLHDRLRVSVVGADGTIFRPVHGEAMGAVARLLTAVTDVTPSPRASLKHVLADPDELGNPQALTAWLGLLTSADAAALVAATIRVRQLDALVPDARAFRLPIAEVAAHEEACQLLRSAGWNLANFGPETTVAEGWQRLLAQREAR